MKKLILGLLIGLVAPVCHAAGAYETTVISTTTGKEVKKIAGVLHISPSSTSVNSPTITFDGATGSIRMSSGTFLYGLTASSVSVPGTIFTSTTTILKGPVGIGTASPGYMLDIVAGATKGLNITSTNEWLHMSSTTLSAIHSGLTYSNGNRSSVIYSSGTGANLEFRTGAGENGTMAGFIDSSQRWGIGTLTPGTPLDVAGTGGLTVRDQMTVAGSSLTVLGSGGLTVSTISLTATAGVISMNTVDGTDTKKLSITGGGIGSAPDVDRGATIALYGNEFATAGFKGRFQIAAGNVYSSGDDGGIVLYTNDKKRQTINYDGSISIHPAQVDTSTFASTANGGGLALGGPLTSVGAISGWEIRSTTSTYIDHMTGVVGKGSISGIVKAGDNALSLLNYGGSASGMNLNFIKSRTETDTGDANVSTLEGDVITNLNFYGTQGGLYHTGASIIVSIDAAPTAAYAVPAGFNFKTRTYGASTLTSKLIITSSGTIYIHPEQVDTSTFTSTADGGGLALGGPLNLPIRTVAQLNAITPKAGDRYQCSNCTVPYDMVVGTGATIAGFRAETLSAISTVTPGTLVPKGIQ
jgi:hypothetical protein